MIRICIFILLLLYTIPGTTYGSHDSGHPVLTSVRSFKTHAPDSAFYIVNDLYSEAEKDNNDELTAYCALELGEILYYLGDFDLANTYLIEAIEYFELHHDKKHLAEAYTWQGIVVQYARQMPLALSYYNHALNLYTELNDTTKTGELYGWIGHYYEKTGLQDSALYYQHKAKNILIRQKQKSSLARIFDNIGSLFEDKGLYDSAHYYFRRSMEINQSENDVNSLIVNMNNIGDIHRKNGNLQKSLIYTDSALSLANQYHIDYQKRSAHRDFAKTYFLLKDYKKAYKHLDKAYIIYRDILNEENSRRITLLQTIYEAEKQESRIKLLEKEKRINQLFKYGATGAFITLFVIAVIVIYNQLLKVRQSRKILNQKSQLFKKEKELNMLELKNVILKEEKLNSEIENQKFIENELQKSLELKSQLITSQTLQIIRKNNFLEKLKQELDLIKKSEKADRITRINGLMNSINHDITSDENWNDFNIIFSQVHKDFFRNIKNKYPDISPAELRLCSLLKLNLQSNEIATILNISTDSLRIARYRLRKKLDLNKNEDLVSHLINI